MAEILVLVDHTDGDVTKVTLELLTLARRLGEPSAVFVGSGFDAAKDRLAEYGAAKVYVADGDDVSSYLVGPSVLLGRIREEAAAAAHGQDGDGHPGAAERAMGDGGGSFEAARGDGQRGGAGGKPARLEELAAGDLRALGHVLCSV